MTRVLHLPDDVATILEARAAARGLTVIDLVCEMAGRPARATGLEDFIGCVDIPTEAPLEIRREREDLADELWREHDALDFDVARNSPQSPGLSLDLD